MIQSSLCTDIVEKDVAKSTQIDDMVSVSFSCEFAVLAFLLGTFLNSN